MSGGNSDGRREDQDSGQAGKIEANKARDWRLPSIINSRLVTQASDSRPIG
jgi:hypothetical protein